MAEKIISISLSILILGQAAVIRYIVGTWLFPASLFGLFWFLVTFFPLILAFNVPINVEAVIYILICCIVFSSSTFIVNWKAEYRRVRVGCAVDLLSTSFLKKSFYLLSISTILCIILNTLAQGISIADIFLDTATVASQYIEMRYTDSLNVTVYGQASVIFTYVAAMLGGLVYSTRNKNKSGLIIILIFLIPSIAVMMIHGNKGTLFLAAAYFFAGIFSYKILTRDLKLFDAKSVLRVILYVLLIFPIVIFSFYVRGLQDESDMDLFLVALHRGLLSYSSSHLYAFSDWLSHFFYGKSQIQYTDDFSAYGFYTFMSIFRTFGDTRFVPPGYYDEYYYFQNIIQSNIYTIFRGLIYDFGLIGSFVFMLVFGVIVHVSFYVLLVVRVPVISLSFFVHFLGYVYTSFLISQFVWNSIYATFILFSTILMVNRYTQSHASEGVGNRAL